MGNFRGPLGQPMNPFGENSFLPGQNISDQLNKAHEMQFELQTMMIPNKEKTRPPQPVPRLDETPATSKPLMERSLLQQDVIPLSSESNGDVQQTEVRVISEEAKDPIPKQAEPKKQLIELDLNSQTL